MTCSDMGGTCEEKISGETVEEMGANGKAHVHEQAEAGDAPHQEVVEKMKAISPEEMEKWNAGMKQKFDALPQD